MPAPLPIFQGFDVFVRVHRNELVNEERATVAAYRECARRGLNPIEPPYIGTSYSTTTPGVRAYKISITLSEPAPPNES